MFVCVCLLHTSHIHMDLVLYVLYMLFCLARYHTSVLTSLLKWVEEIIILSSVIEVVVLVLA